MEEFDSLEIHEGFQDDTSVVLEEDAKKIEERCKASNIGFQYTENWEVIVSLNSGREKFDVLINSFVSAIQLLDIQFEDYVVINNHLAICNYKTGYIEASFETIHVSQYALYKKMFGVTSIREIQFSSPITLEKNTDSGKIKIELGPTSNEASLILGKNLRRTAGISLKINGLNISEHDQSLELLKKLSNALFFQIDLKYNLALTLSKHNNSIALGIQPKQADLSLLEFPKMQFNSEPISLYWYARSAKKMPLLQYLAYYQAIEFYYPVYSDLNARKTIRNMFKDPLFNVNDDTNLTKLINSLRSKLGRGFSNEKAQLLSTLSECIEPIEIREFLEQNNQRKEFFSFKPQEGKSVQAKRISEVKLTSTLSDSEIILALRDRIYNIRCKIVHSKSSETDEIVEIILPFSKEAELLNKDIELIKFISQKVITSSANQMFL